MDNRTIELVKNLTQAVNILNSNKEIKAKVNTLKNDCELKIDAEKKRFLELNSNIIQEYEKQINNIKCSISNMIDLRKSENSKLNNEISRLKQELISDKTKNIEEEIYILDRECNSLNIKNTKLVNMKSKRLLKYTVLQQTIFQKILLPFVILSTFVVIVDLLNLENSVLMQYCIILGEILGIMYFKKWYKNQLNCINDRLKEIICKKEELITKKNKIKNDINNTYIYTNDIIIKDNKVKDNILEIEKLSEQMKVKISEYESVKKQKMNDLDESNKKELGNIALLLNEQCNKEIVDLNSQYSSNMEFLENICEVTEEYQSEVILLKLISYLKNERAMNKKEALDLFEKEKREDLEINARIERENQILAIEKRRYEKEIEFKLREFQIMEYNDKRKFNLQKQRMAEEKDLQIKEIEAINKLELERIEAEKLKTKFEAKKLEREQKQRDTEYELRKLKIDKKNGIDKERLEAEKQIKQEEIKLKKQEIENREKAYKNRKLLEIDDRIKCIKKLREEGQYTKSKFDFELNKAKKERVNEMKILIEGKS